MLEQALILRGSQDFASVEAYPAFVETVRAGLNEAGASRFSEERSALSAAVVPLAGVHQVRGRRALVEHHPCRQEDVLRAIAPHRLARRGSTTRRGDRSLLSEQAHSDDAATPGRAAVSRRLPTRHLVARSKAWRIRSVPLPRGALPDARIPAGVRRGHAVLFTPTFQLVQELLAAKRDLALPPALRKLDAFEVIILDDLGYVQQSADEVEVLFTLMAERYERRSMVITSNLVFGEWDRIFKNPMTTAAAIDRLVHHSVILEFDGPSIRAEEAKKRNPKKENAHPT
jgi:hypothetical protein